MELYGNYQHISFKKCRRIGKIIREIQMYQDQPYMYIAEPSIRVDYYLFAVKVFSNFLKRFVHWIFSTVSKSLKNICTQCLSRFSQPCRTSPLTKLGTQNMLPHAVVENNSENARWLDGGCFGKANDYILIVYNLRSVGNFFAKNAYKLYFNCSNLIVAYWIL